MFPLFFQIIVIVEEAILSEDTHVWALMISAFPPALEGATRCDYRSPKWGRKKESVCMNNAFDLLYLS